MEKPLLFLLLLLLATSCNGQPNPQMAAPADRPVGGPCEGCEALYEWGNKVLSPTDTLPDFGEEGTRLLLTGIIYQPDGKTPAEGVILYIYHTNAQGRYPTRGDEEGWARRHGYLRGWIKTGPDGRYRFYTLRPGAYPGRTEPAHIHATLKPPGYSAYYIDDFVFADDPLLTKAQRERAPRGSSGLLQLWQEGALWLGERDIVLGLNIPGYD
ncbi:dioxygenase family protein [Cesiribacter andamanensis]|uniref:Catechol 1,2-dioxygenase 1 n=1 Tax=Cesiribacter andamanensis AMV16 TaxID=1279009 RepID=M7N1V1_9BACT|nr:Catechol 1,2-dioxygenase 1 [Cesiribacter andamanensis]EMR01252.1 Catechol 1,2-dioxygenase 1 [Cesiribacter andamanensis AMV16]